MVFSCLFSPPRLPLRATWWPEPFHAQRLREKKKNEGDSDSGCAKPTRAYVPAAAPHLGESFF